MSDVEDVYEGWKVTGKIVRRKVLISAEAVQAALEPHLPGTFPVGSRLVGAKWKPELMVFEFEQEMTMEAVEALP